MGGRQARERPLANRMEAPVQGDAVPKRQWPNSRLRTAEEQPPASRLEASVQRDALPKRRRRNNMLRRAGEWPPANRIEAPAQPDDVPKRRWANSMLPNHEALKEIIWRPEGTYADDLEMREWCHKLVNTHWNNPDSGLKEKEVVSAKILGNMHNAPEKPDPLGEHLTVRFFSKHSLFEAKHHVYPWELTSTRVSQALARRSNKRSDLRAKSELQVPKVADFRPSLEQDRRKTS